MRLAICTLSAVLLSGCSWLGMGGSHNGSGYGSGGAYAGNCAPGMVQGYGHQGYGAAGCAGGGAGYGLGGYGAGGANGFGGGYGAGANGYGAGAGFGGANGFGGGYGAGGVNGYGAGVGGANGFGGGYGAGGGVAGANGFGAGANGYGAGAGFGGANGFGAGGVNGFGPGGVAGGFGPGGAAGFGPGGVAGGASYGIDGATGQPVLLGPNAGYGSAVGGQYAQFANGQVVGGQIAGGGVQQIQGAPIYVRQPYPSYYQAPRLRVGGAAQPLGLALFGGASSFNSGNLFLGEEAKPAGADGRSVSALDAIGYDDAFDNGQTVGGAFEYDVDRNNTLFVSASRTEYEGQTLTNGTITQDNTASGGAVFTDDGQYSFSDLNETAVEAGLRHYVGGNGALRPYVSGSAGFVHNNRVELTTTTTDTNVVAAPETQEFIREGWAPTAAGMIGAELAVGQNAALGVETGIRWTDDRGTNLKSEDSYSVPVQIRGRLAF